ncbi:uncharacterized protein TNCV_3908571 [Trichonephila clavipes]|nr:uncharacterized protein TNCV_3908571 [Trichonephila clavipes]
MYGRGCRYLMLIGVHSERFLVTCNARLNKSELDTLANFFGQSTAGEYTAVDVSTIGIIDLTALTGPMLLEMAFSIKRGETLVKVSGVFIIKKVKRIKKCNMLLHPPRSLTRGGSLPVNDKRQARHLPQRWHWKIVLQVWGVIHQFTQGTPNCNTNTKATVLGILTETERSNHQPIDRSELPPAARLWRSMGQRNLSSYEQLSEFERGRIIGMKEAGSANRRITRQMGGSDGAIRRCWQERMDSGRFQRHDGSGRPWATADREF